MCEWTPAVQIHVVQRSTRFNSAFVLDAFLFEKKGFPNKYGFGFKIV